MLAAKSMTGLLFGIALDQKMILGIDEKAIPCFHDREMRENHSWSKACASENQAYALPGLLGGKKKRKMFSLIEPSVCLSFQGSSIGQRPTNISTPPGIPAHGNCYA